MLVERGVSWVRIPPRAVFSLKKEKAVLPLLACHVALSVSYILQYSGECTWTLYMYIHCKLNKHMLDFWHWGSVDKLTYLHHGICGKTKESDLLPEFNVHPAPLPRSTLVLPAPSLQLGDLLQQQVTAQEQPPTQTMITTRVAITHEKVGQLKRLSDLNPWSPAHTSMCMYMWPCMHKPTTWRKRRIPRTKGNSQRFYHDTHTFSIPYNAHNFGSQDK